MANRIWVRLTRPAAFYTGDIVNGYVGLRADRKVNTRGLRLEIRGRESTEIVRPEGEGTRTYRSRADVLGWGIRLRAAGIVPPGVHHFPFRFQVPVHALPSYSGTYAKVGYTLAARLDVPWWPDAVWEGSFQVFYARESVRTFSQPLRFTSGGDPRGPQILVELDGDRFFAREAIGCRITLLRVGRRRVRRAYIRLVGGEWACAEDEEESESLVVSEVDIPAESIRVGRPFTFEVPIPAGVHSAYRGTYSYYGYVLQVGLDVAWAKDLIAETPVVIVR